MPPKKITKKKSSSIRKKQFESKSDGCIMPFLHKWKLMYFKGNASAAIFVKGILDGDEVMVKFAIESDPDDNGLEIERKMYMFVKEHLTNKTPHLLSGIKSGVCTIEEIGKYPKLRDEYVQTVNPEIEAVLDEDESEDEGEEAGDFHSTTYDFDEILELTKDENLSKFRKLYYVATPFILGENLFEFIKNPKNKSIIRDVTFILSITLQVAQALSVLASEKIQHNDLHAENVKITDLGTPTTFRYTYPVTFELTTQYKVTIFDFDRVARPTMWQNNSIHIQNSELCRELGQCDRFIPKWDFYMFLTYFIGLLESHDIKTSLRTLCYGGGEFKDIQVEEFKTGVGKSAQLGRACKCVAVKDEVMHDTILTKCARCEADLDRLSLVTSPEDFIKQNKPNASTFVGIKIHIG